MNKSNKSNKWNSTISKIKAVLVSALLFLVVITIPVASVFAGGNALPVSVAAIGNPDAEAPEISAEAAALYSLDMHKVVYGKNENEKMFPYSITKILTCYIALTELNPDDVVTVSAEAAQVYENGTTIYLQEGEEITIRDLIYGALLESGNDAAYALGEAVSGSESAFAEHMNEVVKEWGCKDTHFVNANGWKNDNHYTTAHDMAIIAENCFGNDELRKMSITKEYTIPATNLSDAREMDNYTVSVTKNLSDITGGKTGTWSDDDASLVVSFEREGLSEVVVLMGAEKSERAKDAAKLMDFASKVTPGFIVSSEGDEVAEARVKHGEITKTKLIVDGTTYAYPESEDAGDISVEVDIDDIEAPISEGDVVGTYSVLVSGEKISEYNLLASENIETGWLLSYIYISNEQTIGLAFALLGMLLVVLAWNSLKK